MLSYIILAFTQFLTTPTPVIWEVSLIQNEKTFEVVATATIENTWVVYGPYTNPDGPIPFSFAFTDGIEPQGKIIESNNKVSEIDELFDMKVDKFKKVATFSQKVLPAEGINEITGYLTFMTCNGLKCLPPTKISFSLPIN